MLSGIQHSTKLNFSSFMTSSPNSNDKQKSAPAEHHDAWSGWGAIIGAAAGLLIGLFFHQAFLLGIALGTTGWLVGAFVDRARR
jgi:uncharacterized membrane protein